MFASPEAITALRQNLSQPGKVIFVDSNKCYNLGGSAVHVPLPYDGVTQILVIADSSNNRLIIIDAVTNQFIEQVGNGKNGYKEGSF